MRRRTLNQQDTGLAWVKGHKGIEGNEKADKLCREASILGHESEGVVTPAGLKAWSRRVRAEARGGTGEGILGWSRKAKSAYTWCVTEKGPQRKWLHKIKRTDTPECKCGHPNEQPEQSGKHLVERCRLLAEKRKPMEKGELREWWTRHSRSQLPREKEKGPVEPGKEEAREEDKLESFFGHLYEFHISDTPISSSHIPAELPDRYAIAFVPASTSVPILVSASTSVSVPVSVTAASDAPVIPSVIPSPSTDYSVISSVNFAFPTSSPSCIGQTQ